jgi:hypothetical protein
LIEISQALIDGRIYIDCSGPCLFIWGNSYNSLLTLYLFRSGARSSIAKNLLSGAGIEAYNGGSRITFKNKYALK